MRFYNKKQLLTLKAKIKGLAAEGLRTRHILQTKSGKARAHYWDLKRSIGEETRLHLIAYGLLRGKKFSEIEPNTQVKANDFQYNFPWKRLLNIIILNDPNPNYTWINRTLVEYSYWTENNLKSLVISDKPLANEEIYSIMALKLLKEVS